MRSTEVGLRLGLRTVNAAHCTFAVQTTVMPRTTVTAQHSIHPPTSAPRLPSSSCPIFLFNNTSQPTHQHPHAPPARLQLHPPSSRYVTQNIPLHNTHHAPQTINHHANRPPRASPHRHLRPLRRPGRNRTNNRSRRSTRDTPFGRPDPAPRTTRQASRSERREKSCEKSCSGESGRVETTVEDCWVTW